MLEYMKQESNMTFTENGAVTYESTGSECLDLFAAIGALRRENDEETCTVYSCIYRISGFGNEDSFLCQRYQRRTGRKKSISYNIYLACRE